MPNIESTFGERLARYWPVVLATIIAVGSGVSIYGGLLATQLKSNIEIAKMQVKEDCDEIHKEFLTYRTLESQMKFRDQKLAMLESEILRLREELEQSIKTRVSKLELELKVHTSSHASRRNSKAYSHASKK